MIKLSVLVPVYNVESYIERCVHSLMKQTMLSDIEFIFVDDASPDNSISLLESVVDLYPLRRSQVKVLHHKKNKGLAAARNTALNAAAGEYVWCCDSDDWVDLDTCEKILQTAQENSADIVAMDCFIEYQDGAKRYTFPDVYDYRKILDAFNDDTYKWGIVFRLVKRSLFIDNNLLWIEGFDYGEDLWQMVRLHFFFKKYRLFTSASLPL